MGGEPGDSPEIEDVHADQPMTNAGPGISVERTDYPYGGDVPSGPAREWSVEDDCHVELTIRTGGQQLILRREWPNDQASHQQSRIAIVEAENLVKLAQAYVDRD